MTVLRTKLAAMLLASSFLAPSAALPAQISASAMDLSSWSHVQAIAPGTRVHVNAKHHGGVCTMKSATDGALTCTTLNGDKTIARADVKSIKLTRRLASTLFGTGIGAGATAALFAGIVGSDGFIHRSDGAVVGLGVGGIIGAPIGFFSDMARGPLVYKAP